MNFNGFFNIMGMLRGFQRIVAIFMVFMLVVLSVDQSGMLEVSAAVDGDFNYSNNGDGTATITPGYIPNNVTSKGPIPANTLGQSFTH